MLVGRGTQVILPAKQNCSPWFCWEKKDLRTRLSSSVASWFTRSRKTAKRRISNLARHSSKLVCFVLGMTWRGQIVRKLRCLTTVSVAWRGKQVCYSLPGSKYVAHSDLPVCQTSSPISIYTPESTKALWEQSIAREVWVRHPSRARQENMSKTPIWSPPCGGGPRVGPLMFVNIIMPRAINCKAWKLI